MVPSKQYPVQHGELLGEQLEPTARHVPPGTLSRHSFFVVPGTV
jgi:hypothetical protein